MTCVCGETEGYARITLPGCTPKMLCVSCLRPEPASPVESSAKYDPVVDVPARERLDLSPRALLQAAGAGLVYLVNRVLG